jgi:para-nitrobenzyl esterase
VTKQASNDRSVNDSAYANRGSARSMSEIGTIGTPLIQTTCGTVSGTLDLGVRAFKGIPYGEATGGAARFKPPTPARRWDGVRRSVDFGAHCPQNNHDFAAWHDAGIASEDCLVLNVWTPSPGRDVSLPVMVWLHGGAFVSGSGGLEMYDGKWLSHEGEVVVVSLNHRLNIFGYLHLAQRDPGYSEGANVGQQDIVLALRWVQENIAAFGGDPGNVTLFGESGGGAKISALCAMPAAKGLFHKAIIQSGSMMGVKSEEMGTQCARLVLDELDVPVFNLEQLHEMPVERLCAAEATVLQKYGVGAFWPVADGVVIPASPWCSSAPAVAAGIPMMIGTTLDETAYFMPRDVFQHPPVDDARLKQAIQQTCLLTRLEDQQLDILIDSYRTIDPGVSNLSLLLQISTDTFFFGSAVQQAEMQARQAPVHMYRFDWRYPCYGGVYSPHGGEIPFVFGTLDYHAPAWDEQDSPQRRAAADPSGSRHELAAQIQRAWAAFARTGDPSHPSLPAWPVYTSASRETMLLGKPCHLVADPERERREIITHFLSTNQPVCV